MYYTYTVLDVDGNTHEGLVAGDCFVDALEKIDDYYYDIHATSVELTCATTEECFDVDDMSDEEDEDEDYSCDESHDSWHDGNIQIKAKTEVNPYIPKDELDDLMKCIAEIFGKDK